MDLCGPLVYSTTMDSVCTEWSTGLMKMGKSSHWDNNDSLSAPVMARF